MFTNASQVLNLSMGPDLIRAFLVHAHMLLLLELPKLLQEIQLMIPRSLLLESLLVEYFTGEDESISFRKIDFEKSL